MELKFVDPRALKGNPRQGATFQVQPAKTSALKAAREAWEREGFRVVGGALAGKAAEGLEKEAAIAARTLASWELRWGRGTDLLDGKTVFVMDEAGMVASRQMALHRIWASCCGSAATKALSSTAAGLAKRAL